MRIIDWSSDVCSSDLGNPHIQTSPENIARVAGPLSDKLAELDPADKADYARRYASFDTRWQAAMAKWTAEATPLKGVAVVSAHKGWVYMYHWLGMNEVATLEPKPGIPPSGDRKSVVEGTRVSVRVDLGGRRFMKKNKTPQIDHIINYQN